MTNLLVLLYMQFDSVVLPLIHNLPPLTFCTPYLSLAFSACKERAGEGGWEGLSEEGVKGLLSGDYKTARHLETVKKRETDLPGGSVALELAICFHASRRGDAEDPPRMGAEVPGGRGVGGGGARTERGMGFSGPKLARLPTEPRCRAVLWMCVVPGRGGGTGRLLQPQGMGWPRGHSWGAGPRGGLGIALERWR